MTSNLSNTSYDDDTQSTHSPKIVWVLGNGQLGAMLKQAGNPINVDVYPIGIDAEEAPRPSPNDHVTAEQELWPDTPATQVLAAHANFVNGDVFAQIADRFSQKSLLDTLELSTSPWQAVSEDSTAAALFEKLGDDVLLKQRKGGYDGKGQHWLHAKSEDTQQHIPDDWRNTAIAEAGINFDEEVSLVAARDRQGEIYTYPLALNKHVDGILTASVVGLSRLAPYQAEAKCMLSTIQAHLDYVGVMAMECFRVGDKLLINELAPRVHNSGHWSQAGASIDQFEAHLRCVADLPMSQPQLKAPSVMINLLGTPWDERWLSVPGAEVVWYRKSPRPGRKLGHINFSAQDPEQLLNQVQALQPLLPAWYGDVFKWIAQALEQSGKNQ